MAEPRRREPWEFNPDGPPVSDIPGDRSVFDRPNREPWEINPESLHTPMGEHESPLGTSEFERRYPNRSDRIFGGARNILQGVPILGARIETTPASRDFGRTYPITSGLGRFGAGLVPATLGAYAARGVTNVAANLARKYLGSGAHRTHAGPFADTLGQGIYGSSIAAADAAANNDAATARNERRDNSLLGNALVGFGTSAAGNLATRLFAPSGIGNRFRVDRHTNSVIPDAEHAPILNALGNDPRFLNMLSEFARAQGLRRLGIAPPHGAPTESSVIRHMNRFRGAELARHTANRLESGAARAIGIGAGSMLGGMGGIPGAMAGAAFGYGGNELARAAIRRYGNTAFGRRHLGNQLSPLSQSAVNAGVISGLHNSSEFSDYAPEMLNILGGIMNNATQ